MANLASNDGRNAVAVGSPEARPHVAVVVTHPMTALFLMRGQLAFLRQRGFEVTLICSPGDELEEVAAREGVAVETVPMQRTIAPLQDLQALWRLLRLLRRLRPDIVHASTPKAGLLGMLAARYLRVPIRIYTVRGLRLETESGLRRRVLELMERLTASSATSTLCVGPSLEERYRRLGLARRRELRILAAGSSNGVDAARFRVDARRREEARQLRQQLGIPAEAPVVGFVGRLTHDKGIADLAAAWRIVRAQLDEARLLVVGDFEAGDLPRLEVRQALQSEERCVRTGFVRDPAPYYAMMDVLALPSWREGFPNAPLEAAAAGVPTVGYAATGTVDAVLHGETGTLVRTGDYEGLASALVDYLEHPARRRSHGRQAEQRVERDFRPQCIWQALEAEYRHQLRSMSLPEPPGRRLLDLLASCLALVLVSPVILLVWVLVLSQLGRPVLFRQQRPGRGGRMFTLYKFRTMRDEQDGGGNDLSDAQRLTRLGSFLRRTSLDELPELFNVVRGDMSLVGPRPLLPEYLDLYSPEQARRHAVKPGITGWAQIHGRNTVDWAERLRLDTWYVDHRSLFLDLKILLSTIAPVVKGVGVSADGHETMPKFRGER